jgi:glycosyltransferase involved in cell wall biosynthesis
MSHAVPNVVLEAIACGRPVLAFSTGGIPDMVKPGVSGWLVHDISPEGLARGLMQALDETAHDSRLEASSRALAEAEFAPPQIARRYEELFNEARLRSR